MPRKNHGRIGPLQAMWKAPKPPTSDTRIDKCNNLHAASLGERVSADNNKAAEAKIRRRSRGGQHRPKEPGKESDSDSFEKPKAAAITKRRAKGSQEQLVVDFKERRRRPKSEKLVVDFPSAPRARRAHQMNAASRSRTKMSTKPHLKNSIRTIDTEVSYEDAIKAINSYDKKKNEKKGKRQLLGDLDKLDWSESSIVWGDEWYCCDEESSHEVYEFIPAKDPSEVTLTATSNLPRQSSGGERSIASSRSLMSANLSDRSVESRQSTTLWQSFSKLTVSRKKLEP